MWIFAVICLALAAKVRSASPTADEWQPVVVTTAPRGINTNINAVAPDAPAPILTEAAPKGARAAIPLDQRHWAYEKDPQDISPDDWQMVYPNCGKKKQSPIRFITSKAITNVNLGRLSLVDYDDTPINNTWTVINNGHTIQWSAKFVTPPQIQYGGLGAKYTFAQMHMHWGATNVRGSEHAVDDKQYPLELHMVHLKKGEAETDAYADQTGVAVLGIFFELDDDSRATNNAIDQILSAVDRLGDPPATLNFQVNGVSLADLVPQDSQYFRYQGSLTTPPCYEAVQWTVLKNPLKVSSQQLTKLRRLRGAGSTPLMQKPLVDNFRPIQPLADRVVYFYPGTSAQLVSANALPNPAPVIAATAPWTPSTAVPENGNGHGVTPRTLPNAKKNSASATTQNTLLSALSLNVLLLTLICTLGLF